MEMGKNRNINIDIVRIIATLFVISVHFLLNSGFYNEPIISKKMMLFLSVRTIFICCVPLFLMITGYLMSNKELSKKYYKGLIKTILIYFIISFMCVIYKHYYLHMDYSLLNYIKGFFDFSNDSYSWYIEMYVGLFLLIPFLNMIIKNIKKSHFIVLLITMIILCSLPTLLNVFNYSSLLMFFNTNVSSEKHIIANDYWYGIWPLLYYLIGAYIRKFDIKISIKKIITLFIFLILIFGLFNIKRNYGLIYYDDLYMQYFGLEAVIISTLIFLMFNKINIKFNSCLNNIVLFISNRCLGIYLASNIVDNFIYSKLIKYIPLLNDRLYYFVPTVLLIFLLSFIISVVAYYVEELIVEIYKKMSTIDYKKIIKKIVNYNFLFYSLLLFFGISFLILGLWKVKYGTGASDELFYLSIPFRMVKGDSLIINEWHLSQLVGFVIYPIMKLYLLFFNPTQILLNFRIIFLVFKIVISIIIALYLKKYNKIGSMLIFIIFLLYTPYNIMQFSYNSLGLIFMTIFALSFEENKTISGLVYSLAVLCNPYLVLFFVCYFIYAIIMLIKKKNKKYFKEFIKFLYGILIVLSLFIIYLIKNISINKMFKVLPNLFLDPEHATSGKIELIKVFTTTFFKYFHQISYIFLIILFCVIFDYLINKKVVYKYIYIALFYIAVFAELIDLNASIVSNYNFIMMPLAFLGFIIIIALKMEKYKNNNYMFYKRIYYCGIAYAFVLLFSSNQMFFAFSTGLSLSSLATVLIIIEYLKTIKNNKIKKIFILLTIALLLTQIYSQVHSFITYSYPLGNISSLTYKIEDGPYKGLYTSKEEYNRYEKYKNDFLYIKQLDEGNALIYDTLPMFYFSVDKNISTHSCWSGTFEFQKEIEKKYFEINKEKKPDYVYVYKNLYNEIKNDYSDYIIKELDNGFLLIKEKKNEK